MIYITQVSKGFINNNICFNYSCENLTMNNCHFHDTFEIYFSCCEGTQFFVNEQTYQITKNSLFVFNNHDIHKILTNDIACYERYVIEFYPHVVLPYNTSSTNLLKCFTQKTKNRITNITLSDKDAKELRLMLDLFGDRYHSTEYGHDVLLKTLLCEILIFINRRFENATTTSTLSSSFNRISEIIHFIDENIANNLKLDIIANHFYLSKYHLGCIFKEATGFTIGDYILHKRIVISKKYLDKGLSVTEACYLSGFSTYSHFIRTFTSKVGVSPKKYSKGNLNVY